MRVLRRSPDAARGDGRVDRLAPAVELTSEVHVHSSRYVAVRHRSGAPAGRVGTRGGRPTSAASGSRTTSDWAFLADLPAVKIGPGETRRSHRPDEYITRTELAAGVAFYRRFVPACLADWPRSPGVAGDGELRRARMSKTVLLAFSGGLDTSFCVVWLAAQGWSGAHRDR